MSNVKSRESKELLTLLKKVVQLEGCSLEYALNNLNLISEKYGMNLNSVEIKKIIQYYLKKEGHKLNISLNPKNN